MGRLIFQVGVVVPKEPQLGDQVSRLLKLLHIYPYASQCVTRHIPLLHTLALNEPSHQVSEPLQLTLAIKLLYGRSSIFLLHPASQTSSVEFHQSLTMRSNNQIQINYTVLLDRK